MVGLLYGLIEGSTDGWSTVPLVFIVTVALGDAKPDEAGSASGSLSSIQQLASAIGSAAVTSIFFHAAPPDWATR